MSLKDDVSQFIPDVEEYDALAREMGGSVGEQVKLKSGGEGR